MTLFPAQPEKPECEVPVIVEMNSKSISPQIVAKDSIELKIASMTESILFRIKECVHSVRPAIPVA
jgi:hypothetical protein